MLYLKKSISETSVLGIWRIDESQEELTAMLDKRVWLDDIFSVKSDVRRQEKLAVRMLLKELAGEEKQISYYDTGRPYLGDGSYNISVSHTRNYVAVILSSNNPVGIDIEQISDKVKRVRSRFVSEKEYIDPENELIHLLLHWSAKETIYKLLNMPDIELKEEAIIQRFTPQESGVLNILNTRGSQQLCVAYLVDPDFVLTYTLPASYL